MAKDTVLKNKMLLAIRKHCLDCMGGNKDAVAHCKASREEGRTACEMHAFRDGPLTTEKVNSKGLTLAIKRNCQKCIGPAESVEKCMVDGSGNFPKCKLWDFRTSL